MDVVDAATGDTRWTAEVPVGLGRGVSSLAAADGGVYVGTNDEYARVPVAAAGSAVFRGSGSGLHALGALPSA
ncbi:PQQ-binding-like beta-propeller repeat protein [Kitasatospora sp. NPDC101183]|uniref:PQQ-binding-like beta-propeller repeat protein n=1 Tax=Kitasatospora sp. NPDC101183 TaxID=3364100 RepID=UPI0038284FB9